MFIDFAPVRLLLQARILLRRDFRVQFRGYSFASLRCNWQRRFGWELLTGAGLCCSILLVFSHFCMRNVLLLLPLSPTILELEEGTRRVMTVKYAKKNFVDVKAYPNFDLLGREKQKQKVFNSLVKVSR